MALLTLDFFYFKLSRFDTAMTTIASQQSQLTPQNSGPHSSLLNPKRSLLGPVTESRLQSEPEGQPSEERDISLGGGRARRQSNDMVKMQVVDDEE